MVDGTCDVDVVSYREAISREALAANVLNVTECSGNVGCKDRSDSVSEVGRGEKFCDGSGGGKTATSGFNVVVDDIVDIDVLCRVLEPESMCGSVDMVFLEDVEPCAEPKIL